MVIERINDFNYNEFRDFSRTVLTIGKNGCDGCERQEPILKKLSEQKSFIHFGKIFVDEGGSTNFKRNYSDLNQWILPTSLMFRNGKEISRVKGFLPYPAFSKSIYENLILDSKIFIKSNSGKYVPAIIKHLDSSNGIYTVQLEENSDIGSKNSQISIPENRFQWNLESKLKK